MMFNAGSNRLHELGRIIRPLVPVVLLGIFVPGCSQTVVSLKDGNASNQIHETGVVFGNQYIQAEGDPGRPTSNGLNEVIVEDNFLFDVIGVVTLGFFKPVKVTYRNIKPPVDDGGDLTPPSH